MCQEEAGDSQASELLLAMLVSHLRRHTDRGWVLEGLPHTVKMAQKLLEKASNFCPDCCIMLDLEEVKCPFRTLNTRFSVALLEI